MTTPSDLGARARLDAAFAAEERRGLMLASAARSVAVLVVLAWLAYSNPERGLAYAWVLGVALLQGLKPRGPHTLRGRDAPIDLWTA